MTEKLPCGIADVSAHLHLHPPNLINSFRAVFFCPKVALFFVSCLFLCPTMQPRAHDAPVRPYLLRPPTRSHPHRHALALEPLQHHDQRSDPDVLSSGEKLTMYLHSGSRFFTPQNLKHCFPYFSQIFRRIMIRHIRRPNIQLIIRSIVLVILVVRYR